MHIFPIHEQYIKYSSVLLAFYDSSMVKYRKVSSVSFSKMKVNIVIFIAAVDLNTDYRSCQEFPSRHWEGSWRRKTCRR